MKYREISEITAKEPVDQAVEDDVSEGLSEEGKGTGSAGVLGTLGRARMQHQDSLSTGH